MGGLEFTASVVGSLAWPLFILVVVLSLRGPIGKALSARPFKRLKAGPSGVEIEWEVKLDEVRAEVEAELPALVPGEVEAREEPRETAATEIRELRAQLLEVADISPRAAVLESFSRLEAVLREAVPLPDGRPLSSRGLARRAAHLGLLSPQELTIFDDLAVLRNVAAHERLDLDRERAVEYVDLVGRLLQSIAA